MLEVDLPNPELLRLHSALTRVMYLSGAAEIFPEPSRDGASGTPQIAANYGAGFFEKFVDDRIADLRHTLSGLLFASGPRVS